MNELKNLIHNGNFIRGAEGGLPEGWALFSARGQTKPSVRIAGHGGIRVLAVEGNEFSVGCLSAPIDAAPGSSYMMSVTFKTVNGFDAYNSIFFTVGTEKNEFNDGIFIYEKKPDGWIYGRAAITVPNDLIENLQLKIYLKYIKGYALIRSVSFAPCKPNPDRWVRVAVMSGRAADFNDWSMVLDRIGERGANIALMTENFNLTNVPEGLDGKSVKLLAEKSLKYGMYTSGTYLFHDTTDDMIYNNQVLIDRNGEIAGHYYKNHPYDAETFSSSVISGAETPVFETDFG